MSSNNQATCWVVTDGRAGMENQCLGLANALHLNPVVKRVWLRSPWKQLSPYLMWGLKYAYNDSSSSLLPPWPDLLIGSGRASIAASMYVRAASKRDGKPTFTVQIQNPVINPKHFDLVATPFHDGLIGANVISTVGSMHRLTPTILRDAATDFLPTIAHLPRPYVGVVIGGKSKAYDIGLSDMERIVDQLNTLMDTTDVSLLVTPSRRTGEANIALLEKKLKRDRAYLWNMQDPNPYFGLLGASDYFLVTPDSTNLLSEACSTGKPVHMLDLPGGSKKFDRFHAKLKQEGLIRPFQGHLENWSYAPLNDVELVAERVKKMMQERLA